MGTRALTGRLARRASLLALGALALHQLRYALAYGDGASSALAQQGHGYLADLAPLLLMVALCVVCARLVAAALGRLGASSAARTGPWAESVAFAAALVAIFSAQELTEGLLAAGHPGGFAGLAGHGGIVAIPLALAIGALAAAIDRALSRAERSLAALAHRRRPPRGRPADEACPAIAEVAGLALRPLAFGLARRPPPLLLG
jgi:hypothetical protein